jgi:cytochrome P450
MRPPWLARALSMRQPAAARAAPPRPPGNAAVTDKQMRDELQTLMLAGSDTTATTLAFSIYVRGAARRGAARRAWASCPLRPLRPLAPVAPFALHVVRAT